MRASKWSVLTPKWMRCDCGSCFGSMTWHKKRTSAGNNHRNDFESDSNNGVKKVPIYMFLFDQVPLPAGPQEGPETALCGTVKAARWQQDNIGVRFHSMTSHKKRLRHEARIRTTLKGPRSPWKSNVMNSCHW